MDSVSNQAPVVSLTEVRHQKSVPGSCARPAAKTPRCKVHSRIKGCGGAKCFPQHARKDTGKQRDQPTHEVEEAVRGPAKVVRRRTGDHRVEPPLCQADQDKGPQLLDAHCGKLAAKLLKNIIAHGHQQPGETLETQSALSAWCSSFIGMQS